MSQVIAFVSGKGGMGKTALCAAVAAALAKSGKRVLCIDCDSGPGDLAHYLGMAEGQNLSYSEVCRGDYPLSQASAHPNWLGLQLLSAPSSRETVTADAFAALLRQAKQRFDFILLDSPQRNAPADQWLLVTMADPAAIRGARHLADRMEVAGNRNIRLLVNAIDQKELAAFSLTVDDIMDQVGLPILGILPRDPAVKLAPVEAKALLQYTKKGAAAAVLRIADRLQDIRTPIPGRIK